MEKAIDGFYNDFVPLTQTLPLLSKDEDSMASGLLQQFGNIKFLSAVYLLHQVLLPLTHLIKVFQAGYVSFAAIGPAINYTLEALKTVSKEKRPLSSLQKDLCTDDRLSVCDLSSPSAHQEQNLTNLTDRYVKALKEKIKHRFNESLPVLTAFRIFDVTAIPNISDVAVQMEISETEDEEPENIYDSKVVQIEEEGQLQLEVNTAITVMNLPDGGDSDSDSAFESDNDYDQRSVRQI